MPSPMPVLCKLLALMQRAQQGLPRVRGCSASWGIWFTNSASTESRSALFKSSLMVAGESSSLRTTGFALFIECVMLNGKTAGRKTMFLRSRQRVVRVKGVLPKSSARLQSGLDADASPLTTATYG